MNVDEFFTLFESEFYKIFSQFSKKILQQEVTTDLRDLLKTIAKKWEEDKLMKSVSEELISEHFLEINRLLNRWHHKESTPWGYVNDSIERAIKILKSIERASKNYSVSTQETIDKITNSWSKVDKNTQYAFSFEAQVFLFKLFSFFLKNKFNLKLLDSLGKYRREKSIFSQYK